ncbi:MAG: imelysin family protein [Hoeflea sp.]|uniref:imelysin family protein n=1 Tax=Hoeflea sp. TaxID=1940281 RepID=UPI00272FA201|nr:imelysin family protein [Hoeflea sp.]MDP2119367.1 imelysin family protein [Hoeflea sp.]
MRPLLALILGLVLCAGGARAEEAGTASAIGPVLKRMVTDHVRPAYAAFGNAAAGLETSFEALCAEPSDDALQAARAAFRDAALAWSRIEWIRLGAVMSENRLERILFFPDRKGTGRKQVQAALATQDEGVTDAAALAGRSVAMQGLGALELILFGTDSQALAEAGASHRCRFGRAASANIAALSGELSAGWDEGSTYLAMFLKPGPDNPLFRTDLEALSVVLGQMIHGLEAIHDTRLGAFLDREDPGRDRPNSALYWRSDMTLPSVSAGVSGLEDLFTRSGIEVAAQELAPRLADTIRFEFTQAIRTADSLDAPVDVLLADPQSREKLVYLAYAIKIIIGRLDQEFGQAGGLAVGFSFGDGD